MGQQPGSVKEEMSPTYQWCGLDPEVQGCFKTCLVSLPLNIPEESSSLQQFALLLCINEIQFHAAF